MIKKFKYHKIIRNLIISIMKNEKLKGFPGIDFIINNGKIYFLEINARLSASYKLYKEHMVKA